MRKLILISAAIAGALAGLCGALTGAALGITALLGRSAGATSTMITVALGLALLVVGCGLGALWVWAGWRGFSGAPGRPFAMPPWGVWLIAIGAVLVLGQIAWATGAGVLLPLFHVAAGILPALLFLAVAVGGVRGRPDAPSRRAAAASLAWGGLGGAGLAMLAEVILLLVAGVAVVALLSAADPTLMQRLQDWAAAARGAGQPPDLSGLADVVRTPWVAVLALLGIAVVVPLIEETAKSLALPLIVLAGGRPTRLSGFLLGVAAGAGFALLEGITNGTLGLLTPDNWATAMAVRGGAAAMHCLASGLAGLGWQAILSEGRWLRGLGLGLTAVALHGAWNLAAGLQVVLSLGSASSGLPVLLVGFLGLLWLGVVIALAVLPGRLAANADRMTPNLPDEPNQSAEAA